MKKPLIVLGIGVIIIAIIFAARSYQEAEQLRVQLEEVKQNTQQQTSEEEVKRMVEEIGQLIVLPEGEQPTLATITDRERLKDVPFFTKAENQDKVLMYVNARKAILYRPSSKKIIEVATLNLSPSPAANQTFAPKLALRNATTVAGLTTTFESQLKQLLPAAEVVVKDNAKDTSRAETLVVDLTGTKTADAQRLATALRAKVGALPTGETKPAGAEFLILLGSDKTGSPTPTPPAASPSPTPSPTTTTPAPES